MMMGDALPCDTQLSKDVTQGVDRAAFTWSAVKQLFCSEDRMQQLVPMENASHLAKDGSAFLKRTPIAESAS
jgi:hypothetical protein